jgi:hypothetical protein
VGRWTLSLVCCCQLQSYTPNTHNHQQSARRIYRQHNTAQPMC